MRPPVQRSIQVWADWEGLDKATVLGALTVTPARAREIFAFAYDPVWLKSGYSQLLDPALRLFEDLDACISPDEVARLLDSESIYSSTLVDFRNQKAREVLTRKQEEGSGPGWKLWRSRSTFCSPSGIIY